ncbi:eukaryotic translation initiation factor 4E type 2 [Ceratobasidium sp. AG-Ba]|nr:eukaryotic translation initiation factor 4E type 2 [Ceratobasidium sp. AG-Ba]QRW05197.1 eukaryotic translation initiation factor 4E type 2 [Ceratobasidium sp. AG-Ba]
MASNDPSAAQATSKAVSDSPEVEPGQIDEGQDVEVDGQKFDEMRTVFQDPQTFNVKHPLYSPWTLWFDSPSTKGKTLPQTPSTSVPPTPGGVPPTPGALSWMDDIKRLIKFDSVEEFWGLYNNIIPPSRLPAKANYYLFKDDIMPAWEDASNKDGGKWSVQLPKEKNRARIDDMWLNTMLAAIGETFDPALAKSDKDSTAPTPLSLISGVIVSSRPQFYRISIWTRLAPGIAANTPNLGESEEELRQRIETIGKCFKTEVLGFQEAQRLGGPLATEVEFASHKEGERKGAKGKKWII